MNTDKLIETLKQAEGYSLIPYKDKYGNETVGYGHLLHEAGHRAISHDEAEDLLRIDATTALHGAESFPFWPMIEADDVRARVIVEMVFNLGREGVHRFVKMASAIARQEWNAASSEILASKAAKQLKGRYQRLATMMRTGSDVS